MKTNMIKHTMVLASLVAAPAFNATADQPLPAEPEKTYSGQVVSVDQQNHTLGVKSWFLSSKKFNLADNCAYQFTGVNNATAAELRPGQQVVVHYQDAHGVQIVDRVEQRPMQFDGMVTAIDPTKHTLTVHQRGLDRPMVIADACKVRLCDGKAGALTDIHLGDHITVLYETPEDTPIVRQISQTSIVFTGRLTAIDLDQKTVKAADTFETKTFNLADNCTIMVNGKSDAKLSELQPNERLQFNYDEIKGVNVVNRISLVPEEQKNTLTTATPSYPGGF